MNRLIALFLSFFVCVPAFAQGFNNAPIGFSGGQTNATQIAGTVPVLHGGTGLSTLGTGLQQIRVNAGGTALEYFTPSAGAANQLTSTVANTVVAGTDVIPMSVQAFNGGSANAWQVLRSSDGTLGTWVANNGYAFNTYSGTFSGNVQSYGGYLAGQGGDYLSLYGSGGGGLTFRNAADDITFAGTSAVALSATRTNASTANFLQFQSTSGAGSGAGGLWYVDFAGNTVTKAVLTLSDASGDIGSSSSAFGTVFSYKQNFSDSTTSVNGSVSGQVLTEMPFRGAGYKKFIVVINDAAGTWSDNNTVMTFPVAFTKVPIVVGSIAGLTATVTKTQVKFTGVNTVGGGLIIEGL